MESFRKIIILFAIVQIADSTFGVVSNLNWSKFYENTANKFVSERLNGMKSADQLILYEYFN